MQKITENVFIETGFRSCNTGFVVTAGGVVVIDTPMIPAGAKKWKAEAEKCGAVRYVINREPHPDHTSGNCYFNCPVISHEGTREAMLDRPLEEAVKKFSLPGNKSGALHSPIARHMQRRSVTHLIVYSKTAESNQIMQYGTMKSK